VIAGPLWQALYDANADFVVNEHDHDYEAIRAPGPTPARSESRHPGFESGIAGRDQQPSLAPDANSEVRKTQAFGVLKLTLRPGRVSLEIHPGGREESFTDSGSGN